MKATGQLKEEHRGVNLMLDVLEKVCDRLDAGREVDPAHIDRILEFLKVFVDKCHHAKEEDCLFPAMERAGVPREGGPIGVMLSEHAAGREQVRAMTGAAEALRRRDRAAAARFTRNARGYIDLLRAHIDREDGILYPIADASLSPEAQDELVDRFERIEEERVGHGRHETFHKMMDELAKIYLAERRAAGG